MADGTEALIREYERWIAVLKSGGSPSAVIFQRDCAAESESAEDESDGKEKPGAAAGETVTLGPGGTINLNQAEQKAVSTKDSIRRCIDEMFRTWTANVKQGLDCRLLTEENIAGIEQVKLKNIHFAWDYMKESDAVLKGLKLYAERTARKPGEHLPRFMFS